MFELPGDGDKSAPEAQRESHGRNLQPIDIVPAAKTGCCISVAADVGGKLLPDKKVAPAR